MPRKSRSRSAMNPAGHAPYLHRSPMIGKTLMSLCRSPFHLPILVSTTELPLSPVHGVVTRGVFCERATASGATGCLDVSTFDIVDTAAYAGSSTKLAVQRSSSSCQRRDWITGEPTTQCNCSAIPASQQQSSTAACDCWDPTSLHWESPASAPAPKTCA